MKIKTLLSVLTVLAVLPLSAQKYVGGDISLLSRYEENGAKYFTHDGEAINDVLAFFSSERLNAMRVRLFVDPSKAPTSEVGEGVCQDIEYVTTLSKKIKAAGFALMLDIHYSDSWADPAKQFTPEAWTSLSDDELYTKVYDYTKDVLQTLKAAGAAPDFVQVGNEISYGMLWGARGTSTSAQKRFYAGYGTNAARFTSLLKNGAKACREVCPDAKIVIHTERVADPEYSNKFYRDMKNYEVDYDIIGLSYYPYFHGDFATLEKTLNTLEGVYPEKEIMIVEAGYPYAWEVPGTTFDYSATYPYSDEGQLDFTEALIAALNKHENVTGLFWWFMEANENGLDWSTKRVTDKWYNAPLFDNRNGRATSALSALKKFLPETGLPTIDADQATADSRVFTIDGRLAGNASTIGNLPAGVYINSGKKIIVK